VDAGDAAMAGPRLIKVQAVDVFRNDCGGGDCEADGREATGSTWRGCEAESKQRFLLSSLTVFWETGKSFRCVKETPSEPKEDSKFDM
jgi:hypothetical protein